MPSYTIADTAFDRRALCRAYEQAKAGYPAFDWGDLDRIFRLALDNSDRFPAIRIQGQPTPEAYIAYWIRGYHDAMRHPPGQRAARARSSCADPAVKLLVQTTRGVSEAEADGMEAIHDLFMAAENIQGGLLEQYVAMRSRPYGLLWCAGNVLHAVDFCTGDGRLLLQVKNKSNTENSSSSHIRSGTPILKWYRLGTRVRGGRACPAFRWEALNALVDEYMTEDVGLPPCAMSEEDYQRFLRRTVLENPGLLADR